jgi:hypothetical protein
MARYFYLLKNVQASSVGHPVTSSMGTGGSIPRVNWQEHEVSTHLNLVVKNEQTFTSAPPVNFTVYGNIKLC